MKISFSNIFRILLYICLLVFFFHKISLFSNVDLGRHLKNGEQLIENHIILKTNFYSFTEPDYPVVNHHWGSGVIFYLIKKYSGFYGLGVFLLLLWIALLFFLDKTIGLVNSKYRFTSFLFLLFIPLFASRPLIRPEVFTYLFSVIFIYLIELYYHSKLKRGWVLFFILLVQVFWNNLHIMFIIGPGILAIGLVARIIEKGNFRSGLDLFWILLLDIAALFVNANGIKGVAEPFLIRNKITLIPMEFLKGLHLEIFSGYSFMNGFTPYILFYILLAFTLIAGFWLLSNNKLEKHLFLWLLSIIFGIIGIFMQRNIIIFSFIVFLFLNQLFSSDKQGSKWLYPVVIVLIFITGLKFYQPGFSNMGLGLKQEENKASKLFLEKEIKPPVFNDFDIGSFIIYYGFPDYRPFIDPRPEAYSEDFSLHEYWPIRLNESPETWQYLDNKYQFNSIILSNKPTFKDNGFIDMINRLPEWKLCYSDPYVIAFKRLN